jgi:hypothetical protein
MQDLQNDGEEHCIVEAYEEASDDPQRHQMFPSVKNLEIDDEN